MSSREKVDILTHEKIVIGILLSLIGGYLDAYSFLLKGHVFANAQTGNVVLLFIALSKSEYVGILKYIIPILTFSLGILISESVKNTGRISNNLRIKSVLILEFILIITIGSLGKKLSDLFVNSVISFIAAIQVANFDRINGNPMATTMITGNLKSSMINISRFIKTRQKKYAANFFNYLLIILGFGFGVVSGSFGVRFFEERSLWFCCIPLLSVFVIILTEEKIRK